MPRRRVHGKRRIDMAPLSRSVMGLAIYGWTEARRGYGIDDPLAPYLLTADGLRALARDRGDEIRREAARLGVTAPWIFEEEHD